MGCESYWSVIFRVGGIKLLRCRNQTGGLPQCGHFLLGWCGLQLPPVGILGPAQLCIRVALYPPDFLLVPQREGLLFLVEKSFQITDDSGHVVREAVDSLGWQGGVFIEFNIFCDVVSHAVDVLPM